MADLRAPAAFGGAEDGRIDEIYHDHVERLGSTHLVTDGGGRVVEHIRNLPYGELRGRWSNSGGLATAEQRHELTAYQIERYSGLQYGGARFSDPEMGMFLTHDPAAEYPNPYTYVHWDPINSTAPSGEREILCAVMSAAVAGYAASSIQAAVNGASEGEGLKAGAIGAGMSAAGAYVGGAMVGPLINQAVIQPVVSAGLMTQQTASTVVSGTLLAASAGQAAYGISRGDYTGLISLGFSIGLASAFAQGPNGPSRGPSFSRGGDQSRLLFWDEAEALYHNVSEIPPGGWETVVVDNSTAPNGAPRAYPGRIGLGGDFSMSPIPHPSDRFSLVVHEAYHVVQFGRGDWVRLGAAWDWTKSLVGIDPYNPQLNRAGFSSYGIENQATLVEWGYRATHNLGAPWNAPSNFPTTSAQIQRLRGLVP